MVRYSVIINRKDDDEHLLYIQVKIWVSRRHSGLNKIYIYGSNNSYGFKHALLSIYPHIEFTTDIPDLEDDFIVVIEPYNYVDMKDITECYGFIYDNGIYSRGIYHNVGIETCILHNRNLKRYTPETLTFYHMYGGDWVSLISKTPSVLVQDFPTFCTSIRITDLKFLDIVVGYLARKYPKNRKIYVPSIPTESDIYTKCGFELVYEYDGDDVDLYVGDVIPERYDKYRSMFILSPTTTSIEGYHLSNNIYMREDYHQRRVVIIPYFNEPDMLNLHIKELYEDFDSFIVGQMDTPYSSNNPISQYIPYVDDPSNKIIRVLAEYPKEVKDLNDSWVKDKYWRQLSVYHESIDPYDLLFILDVDEIVNVSTIRKQCSHNIEGIYRLSMNFHYYNLNWVKKSKWIHGYLGSVDKIRSVGADKIRVSRSVDIKGVIPNGGWHLSYFMNPEKIATKVMSFAHQEYNKDEYINLEHIKKCIEDGKDIFNRNHEDLIPAKPEDRPLYSNLLYL